MFKKKKWVALVRGEQWIVAKTTHRRTKLHISRLAEYQAGTQELPNSSVVTTTAGPDLATSEVSGGMLDRLYGATGQAQSDTTGLSESSRSPIQREPAFTQVEQLKRWLRKEKIPLKDLSIAVSCPGVITRMITLPLLSGKELSKLLTEQVDQYFTFNAVDYVIDYRVLTKFEEDGQKRQRVLLAALPKFQWEKWWSTWQMLGVKPQVVDLASDSLARLYSQLESDHLVKKRKKQDPAASSVKLDVAIVDLNQGRVEFVLLEQGIFFLYSDLGIDLTDLAEARDYGIDSRLANSAESLPEGGLPLSLEGEKRKMVEQALTPIFHELTGFFNFFATRHFGKTVDRIYLTGEYADIPLLIELFEYYLEVPTQVGFPAGWRPYFTRRLRNQRKDWMKYGSLYGLALRED